MGRPSRPSASRTPPPPPTPPPGSPPPGPPPPGSPVPGAQFPELSVALLDAVLGVVESQSSQLKPGNHGDWDQLVRNHVATMPANKKGPVIDGADPDDLNAAILSSLVSWDLSKREYRRATRTESLELAAGEAARLLHDISGSPLALGATDTANRSPRFAQALDRGVKSRDSLGKRVREQFKTSGTGRFRKLFRVVAFVILPVAAFVLGLYVIKVFHWDWRTWVLVSLMAVSLIWLIVAGVRKRDILIPFVVCFAMVFFVAFGAILVTSPDRIAAENYARLYEQSKTQPIDRSCTNTMEACKTIDLKLLNDQLTLIDEQKQACQDSCSAIFPDPVTQNGRRLFVTAAPSKYAGFCANVRIVRTKYQQNAEKPLDNEPSMYGGASCL